VLKAAIEARPYTARYSSCLLAILYQEVQICSLTNAGDVAQW